MITTVAECTHKERRLVVLCDQHGHYFIRVGTATVQRKLTANEVVRYLVCAMQDGGSG